MAKRSLPRICKIEGCEHKYHAKGYCANHYARLKYYGDATKSKDGTPIGAPLKWIKDNAAYDGGDCLKWPFAIGRNGYGRLSYKGKQIVASRLMCITAHGSPSENKLQAAHSCGNGHLACMNPNHLSWKTGKENMADAMLHGTFAVGEKVVTSKLTEPEVIEIRKLSKRISQRSIAKRYGISFQQVSRIVKRQGWAWVK